MMFHKTGVQDVRGSRLAACLPQSRCAWTLNAVVALALIAGIEFGGAANNRAALACATDLTVDTDGDGLTDDLELDLATNYGCPDPQVADSDGDGLTDGDEVLRLLTDPCNPDTDGDGTPDNLDRFPLNPGGIQSVVEVEARFLADYILWMLDPNLITAPNPKAQQARRSMLASMIQSAASASADAKYAEATALLSAVLQRLDGDADPPDWILDEVERDQIGDELRYLIGLLYELY
jgi:hypothetical protein